MPSEIHVMPIGPSKWRLNLDDCHPAIPARDTGKDIRVWVQAAQGFIKTNHKQAFKQHQLLPPTSVCIESHRQTFRDCNREILLHSFSAIVVSHNLFLSREEHAGNSCPRWENFQHIIAYELFIRSLCELVSLLSTHVLDI